MSFDPEKAQNEGKAWCDLRRKTIRLDDKSCELTPREFNLCLLLSANSGWVKSRAQILDAIWPNDLEIDDRKVDDHVKRARKKLKCSLGVNPIRTHYGFGYSWVNPVAKAAGINAL